MYIAILTLLNGDLYDAKVFWTYKEAMAYVKFVTQERDASKVGNFKVNIVKREVEEWS